MLEALAALLILVSCLLVVCIIICYILHTKVDNDTKIIREQRLQLSQLEKSYNAYCREVINTFSGVDFVEGYVEFVKDNWDDCGLDEEGQLSLAVHGMCGETGEFTELFKKRLRNKTFSQEKFLSEAGDKLFYFIKVLSMWNISLQEVVNYSVTKITKGKPKAYAPANTPVPKIGEFTEEK